MIAYLIITFLCVSTSLGFDYCSICSGEHVLCQYPAGAQGDCAGQYTGMSGRMKRIILHRHNELRAKVARGEQKGQPSASNMRKLSWGDELENMAQRWADQCKGGHDKQLCRLTADGSYLSQTLGDGYLNLNKSPEDRRDEAILEAADDWFSNVKNVDPIEVDKYTHADTKYSLMMWAEIKKLGCGYREDKPKGQRQTFKLICDYCPQGTYVGMPIYKRGDPCSACPAGTHCSNVYHGLCTAEVTEGTHGGATSISISDHGTSNTNACNSTTGGGSNQHTFPTLLLISCFSLSLKLLNHCLLL